ncbi:hypothetical protein F0000_22890 [Aquimarina sp. RZ0]|nr:hypothetical protein F0000_22890 [Aquimarina sp. RZ0]
MKIQNKDVLLSKKEFKVLVKKGRSYEYQMRPINKNVIHLWVDLLQSSKDDYLFSNDLTPGEKSISERQIARRWKRHVKDKLNIQCDFYSLKHLHIDIITAREGVKTAAIINGHKSDKMVLKHYAVNEKQRQIDKAKDMDIEF